jgi:hypothetical protein
VRLAVQALGLMEERCAIATQTNEQSFDVIRRLGRGYPRLPFWLFAREGLSVPFDVSGLPNVTVIDDLSTIPPGPCVVVANAAKWSWVADDWSGTFDLQVVDEAFQLPDFRFLQIANLARRIVLVGDPGQIDPVVRGEIERWASDPAGPHIPAPEALVSRYPALTRAALPVSRRLPADTVSIVQPALYPRLPFTALAASSYRALRPRTASGDPFDLAIDRAAAGSTMVQLELPRLITGQYDPELADAIVGLINQLLSRGTTVLDDGMIRRLMPSMIGVACAHVSQVNAVRERLPTSLAGVFVETANRFQGLQRPVMLVHHPLSGRTDAAEFHLDAGRLCVMLSRHRVACFVLAREGVLDMLERYAPSGHRVLGIDRDAEYEGWRAHVTIQTQLRSRGAVVTI